jgi:NADH:ubiquinone oxidoreductase subunit 6 (subunit J)
LFPPLLWFRVPARAWLVIALIAPLLAGFGLDGLRALHRARPSRILIIVGVGLFVAGLYMGLGLGFAPSIAVGMVSGGIIALCCAVYGMRTAIGRVISPSRLVNVIMLCVVVDLLAFMPLWMTWRPAEAWHTPAQRVLAEQLIALDAGRVYSPDYALEQQTAALYDLHLFGGVDPFQIDGVARAIREAGGVQYDGYSVVQPPLIGVQGDAIEMANRDAVPDADQLGAWGVTHIVARAPRTADGLTHIDTLEGLHVYAVDPQRVVAFRGHIPDWGAHDRLPPPDEVAALNRITVSWAGAGVAAFGAILLFIGFLGWRGHMRRAKIHGEGQ